MENFLNNIAWGLCCTNCGSEFNEESFVILRDDGDLKVMQIICPRCGEGFSVAFIGKSNIGIKKMDLNTSEISEDKFNFLNSNPISEDDVINAHNFIQNLGADWTKYLPKTA